MEEHAAFVAACRYENTERRKTKVESLGLRYMGMGVSGGEEGARNGNEQLLQLCLSTGHDYGNVTAVWWCFFQELLVGIPVHAVLCTWTSASTAICQVLVHVSRQWLRSTCPA